MCDVFFKGIGSWMGERDLVVSVVGTRPRAVISELPLVVYVHMSKYYYYSRAKDMLQR